MNKTVPHHFLNKRAKELLANYTKLGAGRNPSEYERLHKLLLHTCPNAFHTKDSLITRKFYHCPITAIPYHSCLISRKRI